MFLTNVTFMKVLTNHTMPCETLYSGKQYLTYTNISILQIVNLLLMAFTIVANSIVIYLLVSRNLFQKNLSMRLILYLSISDCFIAIFTHPLFIMMLARYSLHFNCTFDKAAQFVIVMSKHISGYIIALIGLDRYCKMKYLNRYSEVVRSWRIHLALSIIIFISFSHGFAYSVGTHMGVFNQVYFCAISVDFVVITCVFIAYILTVRVVKKHRRLSVNRKILHNVDKTTTLMASQIIIAVLLFYLPYIILGALRPSIINSSTGSLRQKLNFALFIAYEMIFVSSFANPIIFLNLQLNFLSKTTVCGMLRCKTRSSVASFDNVTVPEDVVGQLNIAADPS